MYRRIGLDPTKTRPSSEALLRRVRKGDRLPRINSLVDICNWCSLEFQLPYGLYDLATIEPPIDLRLGAEGEEYEGIRKDVVHVAGRMTLADARGPFGNPTSDSARSMVTPSTARAAVHRFCADRAAGRPHRRHPDRDRPALPRLHGRPGSVSRRHIIPSSVPSESRHARRGDRRCRRPGRAPRPAGSETVRRARRTHDPRSQRRRACRVRVD